MARIVEFVTYDHAWPKQFAEEAAKIKAILGDNCVAVHHIGSTSVPGLAAKPVIDIIPVVKDITPVNTQGLENLGYVNKGEMGMPFRIYLSKGKPQHTYHLHIWEYDNPEVEKHLLFRDYLIKNVSAREQYAALKAELAKLYKNEHQQYTTSKDKFIKELIQKTGFNGFTIVQPLHANEWQEYHRIRKQHMLHSAPNTTYDVNDPVFASPEHFHFVLMKGINIVAIAHIQITDANNAALRVLANDSSCQGLGYDEYLLKLMRRWVMQQRKNFFVNNFS